MRCVVAPTPPDPMRAFWAIISPGDRCVSGHGPGGSCSGDRQGSSEGAGDRWRGVHRQLPVEGSAPPPPPRGLGAWAAGKSAIVLTHRCAGPVTRVFGMRRSTAFPMNRFWCGPLCGPLPRPLPRGCPVVQAVGGGPGGCGSAPWPCQTQGDPYGPPTCPRPRAHRPRGPSRGDEPVGPGRPQWSSNTAGPALRLRCGPVHSDGDPTCGGPMICE